MKSIITIAALAVALSTGCATVTNGTEQTIAIKTDQPCTATRGDKTATVTPEWPNLTVSKSNDDITLACGGATHTIASSASAAGLTSILWLDFGIVDTMTGAMWDYPSEVDARMAP